MNAGGSELMLVLGPIILFLPTIVAVIRSSPKLTTVLALNLLLAWTGVGWMIALILAFQGPPAGAAHPAAGTRTGPAPGWYPDPWRRHPWRFWDGYRWTVHVSTRDGIVSQDI